MKSIINRLLTISSILLFIPVGIFAQTINYSVGGSGTDLSDADNAIEVRRKKIQSEINRQSETESYVQKYLEMQFINTRTKKIIKKNKEKVWRLVNLFKDIKAEDSLRGTIVNEFHTDQYYWRDSKKLPREDWRRILKLK